MFLNKFCFDKFLILRAFACILVFFSHIQSPYPNFWLSTDGLSAVRIFFILSGYLIGKNYLNGKYSFDWQGVKKFYINRVKRIAPLYYFVVICLFLTSYRYVWQWSSWYKILGIFTFTFDLDAMPYFTVSLWSLSVEMQFYLLAPFLVWLIIWYCKNLKRTILAIFISILASLTFNFFTSRQIISPPNQIRHFFIHFYCFPVGISLNFLFRYLNDRYISLKTTIDKYSNFLFGLALLATYLFLNFNLYFFNFVSRKIATGQIFIVFYTFVLVLLSSILLYLAESSCVLVKQIDFKRVWQKPLTFLEMFGILSYGFYLWHGDILYYFRKSYGIANYSSYFLVLGLSFGTTFIISLVTYYMIEKDIRAMYSKIFVKNKRADELL